MDKLVRFIPTVLAIATLLLDQFSGSITQFLYDHPTVALVVGTLVTAIANVIKPKAS